MTIEQLIKELEKYPNETNVSISGTHWSFSWGTELTIEKIDDHNISILADYLTRSS